MGEKRVQGDVVRFLGVLQRNVSLPIISASKRFVSAPSERLVRHVDWPWSAPFASEEACELSSLKFENEGELSH